MSKLSQSNNKDTLFTTICQLFKSSKIEFAGAVNQKLTLLNWNIGKHIQTEILQNKKPGYGEQIIRNLSIKLTQEFGKGWSKQQLWNCLYIVETFPDFKIIHTLSGQLSWSHILILTSLKDPFQQEFYILMCRKEGWSVRRLRERIG